MVSIKNLKAAKKFGPGYFIREQMDHRGWVQEELAEVLNISPKHLNSILQDKQALSIDYARKLSKAFNTSPQYWLNIDNDYRLWIEEGIKEPELAVGVKAMIYERMPIRDMMKKNWIEKTRDINELTSEVKEYWGIPDINAQVFDEALLPYCKKSQAFNQFNASYAATWFQMAKKVSSSLSCPAYNKSSLLVLFKKLSVYTNKEGGIELFLNELNTCGVKFFVLPHLEKTYLDGAAFLLIENPTIVYTARYKRIDNFWFTLAHELAHVLYHLDDKTTFVLDNLKEVSIDIKEQEANELAAFNLKHSEIINFLKPYFKYLTLPKITECAEKINIHPSIIIGALAFNKTIAYRNLSLFNENVIGSIPKKYIHESIWT